MGPKLKTDLIRGGLLDGTAPLDGAEDAYLPAAVVCERYQVTTMSLQRWLVDEEMAFPRPLYFGRFRYWRVAELVAWERSRPRHGKRDPASAARAAKRKTTKDEKAAIVAAE
jgi:hypothetical protein